MALSFSMFFSNHALARAHSPKSRSLIVERINQSMKNSGIGISVCSDTVKHVLALLTLLLGIFIIPHELHLSCCWSLICVCVCVFDASHSLMSLFLIHITMNNYFIYYYCPGLDNVQLSYRVHSRLCHPKLDMISL